MGSPLIGLAKDALLLNLGRSLPFRVTMMVSERCPLRCTTCSIWQRAEPREPSIDDVDAFLSANRKISWLNLTGGEIFLRGDMVEIFRLVAMRLKGLALLNFPTAGQDPHGIAGQVEAGLATGLRRIVATVSFDGGPTSHDRLRGAAGAFDRAAETWRSLKRIAAGAGGRLSVFAGMTLSEELMALTSDPLGELIAELGLAGSHEIHLNLAHGSKHYYRNLPAARLRLDAIEGTLEKAAAGRRAREAAGGGWSVNLLERIYLGCAREFLSTRRAPLPCKALRCSVFVDAGLDVYPCTIFPRSLGNLRDHDFSIAALRRGALWRDTVKEIKAGRCPGCWTPCEAYPAMVGNILRPGIVKMARSLIDDGRKT